jgi:hypothetical protein
MILHLLGLRADFEEVGMRLLHRNGWAKFVYAIGLLACGVGPVALLTPGDVRVGERR